VEVLPSTFGYALRLTRTGDAEDLAGRRAAPGDADVRIRTNFKAWIFSFSRLLGQSSPLRAPNTVDLDDT
jgi:hypothetical protein